MQDIGFVHFWALQDYKSARPSGSSGAAEVPGAAWFLKPLAADDARPGRAAQRLADAVPGLAESGENDWMRKDAPRRLRQLDAMDAMDELRQIVAAYRAARRRARR